MMEGFHANGAESGEVDLANSDVLPLVRKVVERLPESKPRMYMVSLGPRGCGLGIYQMRTHINLNMELTRMRFHFIDCFAISFYDLMIQ